MESKNLTGFKFEDKYGNAYVIIAGSKGGAIAYEDIQNPNTPLYFCCDAYVEKDKLHGAYFISYTVSKAEFFEAIEKFNEQEKASVETIVSALRKKYYQIPTVFLKLVVEAWQISKK